MSKAVLLPACILACLIVAGADSLHAGWTIDGGPICTAGGVQSQPWICSDDAGGAIVAWLESRFYPSGIYAQRVSELGEPRWAANGNEINRSDYPANRPRSVADGSGGAIFVWEVYYDFATYDLYAQRVDSLGNLLWNADGVAVCTAANDQDWSAICSDGAGGCIITWVDERTSSNSDIYAQRINAAGSPEWATDGIPICTADSIQETVQIIADGGGGALLVWADFRTDGDLYGQKVNGSGVTQWTADGAPVCLASAIQYEPRICSDGAGGMFVAFYDRRATSFGVYMQRIDSGGGEVLTSGGITICDEVYTQREPELIPDGVGGAIVVWEDYRGGTDRLYLYAQRVNSWGAKLWLPASGVPIRVMSSRCFSEVIVSDQAEGAIISWADDRNIGGENGYDVYAQRINDAGTCLWRENGDSLCTAAGGQSNLTATTDGAGGMIVAWLDTRVPDDDIYGQRITIDGEFTAALLHSFSTSLDEAGITITWTLTEELNENGFFISRRIAAAEDFEGPMNPPIERNGLTYSFTDGSVRPGVTYSYRIDVADGTGRRVLFETEPITTPAVGFRLFQNYPNPFNPSTTISFSLQEADHVTLAIYDVAGRLVRVLVNERRAPGIHRESWDGIDHEGHAVSSGIYFYRLDTGPFSETKKMILLR